MQHCIALFIPLAIALIPACSSKPEKTTPVISAGNLEAGIVKLSSDEFTGRKPFTQGESLTLNYLQKEFAEAGLEPGNDTSYLQAVPLIEIKTTADTIMTLKGYGKELKLKGFDEYVIWTQSPDGATLNGEELVYAGFGIVAPEYGWNDYQGLDVKGKIVLVQVNDPGFGTGDSTFFKGSTMTYYGRWTYKFEEAARQGAKGCLVIHDDAPAAYPFGVVQNSWNTSKFYLDSDKSVCDVEGWISMSAFRKIFRAAGFDPGESLAKARLPGFKGEALGFQASASLKVGVNRNTSYNVVGKITGSERPDETIIYTAHWDHLGIGAPDHTGDSIYNGALDNASGTAGIIEIARAFANLNPKPERTIIFLAVTAEEQGLLGSLYYTQNPIYPKESTVANINLDGINSFGRTKDIVLIGMGQSELEDYLNEVCKERGRYVAPDAMPGAGLYFRSDHFNFAKLGIPALFAETGTDNVEKGKEHGRQMIDEYINDRYHQPSDEYDAATWNLDGMVDDLELMYEVGRRLAFGSEWPQWKEGSEFKAIREEYRK